MTEGLHGLHGWQYLFMVLGGLTVVYSFVFWVRPPALQFIVRSSVVLTVVHKVVKVHSLVHTQKPRALGGQVAAACLLQHSAHDWQGYLSINIFSRICVFCS